MTAAESLPFVERLLAYRDIGLMTGKTKRQIADKSSRMRVGALSVVPAHEPDTRDGGLHRIEELS